MAKTHKNLRICNRGHKFYKSSDCPVCPICWSGYYREKNQKDFPSTIAAPALRALLNAKIFNLSQHSKHSELEVLELHGMGPNAIRKLHTSLKSKGLTFNK
jgi:hypothetical protein